MLTELDETLVRLERFHDAYQAQWMQENKPHGFDVQDIRLGGLMQRVKTCRARLEDYCAGQLENWKQRSLISSITESAAQSRSPRIGDRSRQQILSI